MSGRRASPCLLYTSLGVNNGYYQGAGAVKAYYQGLADRTALESRLIQQKYADQVGNLSAEEAYGIGIMDMKSLVAPVIEIDVYKRQAPSWGRSPTGRAAKSPSF